MDGLEGYTMRKCPGCGRKFDDTWGVCLYCEKQLVSNAGAILPNTIEDGFKLQLPKSEEVIEVVGTIVKVIAYVIGGILLIIACIVTFCFAAWLVWAILNIFFGDHN